MCITSGIKVVVGFTFEYMDWQKNFFPVSVQESFHRFSVGNMIIKNQGEILDLDDADVVFFSVENKRPEKANAIRKQLYSFRNADCFDSFLDLGDYILADEFSSSHIDEIGYVLSELFLQGKAVLVYTDNELFMPEAIDRAYKYLEQAYSLIECNRQISNEYGFGSMRSSDWLTGIIQKKTSKMHHYGLLAYQSNNVDMDQLEYLHKLGFEAERLGALKANIAVAEPLIRMGNAMVFDGRAIKTSYLGMAHAWPNGLNGEEACAVFKYAGANANMNIVSFTSDNLGQNDVGAHQYAQMVWYFVEGMQIGFNEQPLQDEGNYLKYHAHFDKPNEDIQFIKSRRTDKWWIYLPVDHSKYPEYKYLIPCSYVDYETAMRGAIPEKWIQAIARLDS